ncbi:DUF2306 domain-containing protein [Labrys monachus]|uniref:Membrane protein n=1 Tax=Labrys monachus TaxID=217067 RepID=A0ABU0FE00_9HYPH|nr:DUF2306 domain-containing protein [Labrys monachus]MDQ0392840.1 putative membrane protein [Labrys monachus]
MTLEPLLAAPAVIQLHVAAAAGAFLLGLAQFAMPKGTPRHRAVGYVWVWLMAVLAVSSFWIHQIRLVGPFSPIHLLSMLTLVGLPRAVWLARHGRIAAHRRLMLVLFFFALIGAGIFTLLPGRLMYAVVFG